MATERARVSAAHDRAGRTRQGRPDDILSPLLTLEQTARMLSVSPKTIRRLVGGGQLPCVRVGRVLRFQPADLFRFVEARKE